MLATCCYRQDIHHVIHSLRKPGYRHCNSKYKRQQGYKQLLDCYCFSGQTL